MYSFCHIDIPFTSLCDLFAIAGVLLSSAVSSANVSFLSVIRTKFILSFPFRTEDQWAGNYKSNQNDIYQELQPLCRLQRIVAIWLLGY